LAELRAQTLETRPHLLAVWDGKKEPEGSGTWGVVARWPDATRRTIIPIDELLAASPRAKAPAAVLATADEGPALDPAAGGRVIRALLFADIVGYSKLEEEHTRAFPRGSCDPWLRLCRRERRGWTSSTPGRRDLRRGA